MEAPGVSVVAGESPDGGDLREHARALNRKGPAEYVNPGKLTNGHPGHTVLKMDLDLSTAS